MPVSRPRLAPLLALLAVTACAERTPVTPDAPSAPPPSTPPPTTPPTHARNRTSGTPLGWYRLGSSAAQYDVGRDVGAGRDGSAAAYLLSREPNETDFVAIAQDLDATPYRGQRIRWSGWVRAWQVTGSALLWARVIGGGRALAFDNMTDRPVNSTTDWRNVSIVLDVAPTAEVITVGAILGGRGDMLADDLRFEVVDRTVPVTDLYAAMPRDSLPTAPLATTTQRTLLNLAFEGGGDASEAAFAWLRDAVRPVRTTIPDDDDSDLAPFGAMLGNATLIGMGEGTHGTREFFDLKHRVFRYLVRQLGVTHFAIEGAWAEANELDHFVRTGDGDPTRLLSKLGFWTWNTIEVRDLILWMREWNRTAPVDRQLRFLGFDMQAVALPADTVEAFVARALPAMRDSTAAWLACLEPYRGRNGQAPRPRSEYLAGSAVARAACRAALDRVADLVAGYRGPEPAEVVARTQQSAQILRQWERVAGEASPALANARRDSSMAANVAWLVAQAPAGTRLMLWAHNEHVAVRDGWMGRSLRDRFGDAYRSVALLFGRGTFNAVQLPSGGLRTLNATNVPTGSLESFLGRTGVSTLMFDARRLLAAEAQVAAAFRGPLFMRSIGSVFDPQQELSFFTVRELPDHFDHVFFVNSATATRLLPFVPN